MAGPVDGPRARYAAAATAPGRNPIPVSGSMSDVTEAPAVAAAAERLGCGPANVVLLSKGGLRERLDDVIAGAAPADFYYGFLGLVRDGVDARMQSTSARYTGAAGHVHHVAERVWARLTGISRRHHFLDWRRSDWRDARVVIGFTDHFSLTLGDYFRPLPRRPFTIGLFHGLSDFGRYLTPLGRRLAASYVPRALDGLDHTAFMSPADRVRAIERHGLRTEAASVFHFGVDASFWTPPGGAEPSDGGNFHVVSVGSDPNRDYDTLVTVDLRCPIHIVTALPVTVPGDRANVTVTRGNFFRSPLNDVAMRDLYRRAGVVAIPVHDVFQPSGQSVALQAMACGRPVVVSRNKGLWAPDLLIDEDNCLLVPPGDPAALTAAIRRLMNDATLARRLGARARETVERHFTLAHMERALADLVSLAPGR